MTLEVRPITFRDACAFVAKLHRHNAPPRGHKFSVAIHAGEEMVGVAMAGRPVARHYDDGLTMEINRTCTDGTRNANSMLYGAVRKAAFAMGYKRVLTYTQAEESGASLKAAGFIRAKELPARGSWSQSSLKLQSIRDPVGTGGVDRVLWVCTR